MTTDLARVSAFLAVAEARVAAERLGKTRSAVSQALRRLKTRLDVALVQRTSRSVSLTEAGQRFYDRVAPAIGEVATAMGSVASRSSVQAGFSA